MSSVSQIEVLGPGGSLYITTQQEVEQHLSDALALHFQLTAHSPSWLTPFGLSVDFLAPPQLPNLSCRIPTNAWQRWIYTHSS